jgi:DNA repair protein RadC
MPSAPKPLFNSPAEPPPKEMEGLPRTPQQLARERLRLSGASALSLAELLELLGPKNTGKRGAKAADAVLVAAEGRLRWLAKATLADLERIPGVGTASAARILAALELGARLSAEALPERPRIRGPEDVYDLVAPRMRDLPHEEFHALLLNTQHRVLRDVLVTRGILDASLIHPREVFRPAILERAAAVVLVHNHPSGDPMPSAEDRTVTRQMTEAGKTIGIPVLDHLIVADSGWQSVR